jgi:hypothetical protein
MLLPRLEESFLWNTRTRLHLLGKVTFIPRRLRLKLLLLLEGDRSPRFNKGTPVYLYEVHSTRLELSATFPNRFRVAAFLDIPASTLFNYIKSKTIFQVKGLSYILSKDKYLTKIKD